MAAVAGRDVVCEVCSRSFRREGDKKRPKCVAERQKPVSEQRGASWQHTNIATKELVPIVLAFARDGRTSMCSYVVTTWPS